MPPKVSQKRCARFGRLKPLVDVNDLSAALRSSDFTEWEQTIRPLLEATFVSAHELAVDEARSLVAETMELACEFWDVVGESERPQLWAYKTAAKLLEARGHVL